ncbi:G-protein coupled receptor 161-like [Liolophura sinensis]|uniref:G-protein coupled receptor 161-like n=1 Tax=Liolophura sinensis TaxID=3198878 RepID=UPI0031585F26
MTMNATGSNLNATAPTVDISGEGYVDMVGIKALKTIVIVIISLAIILSNFINITVLRTTQQIPKVAKIFLTNLGVADLCVGLVTCLPCVVSASTGAWPYGIIWCQIAGILHGTCVTVSIWTLAVVSIERFFAVIYPLKYKNKLNRNKCVVILVFLWTAALISFISPMFTVSDFIYYHFTPGNSMCGMYWENIWLCIATGVYIPILSGGIILFTTVSITRALKKSRPIGNQVAPASNNSGAGKGNKKQKDEKAVMVLITTTLVFFTLWGPYVAMVYAAAFDHNVILPPWLEFVLTWMANSNSFVNVIIYSAIYEAFRTEAKALILATLRCRCYVKRPTAQQSNYTDGSVS